MRLKKLIITALAASTGFALSACEADGPAEERAEVQGERLEERTDELEERADELEPAEGYRDPLQRPIDPELAEANTIERNLDVVVDPSRDAIVTNRGAPGGAIYRDPEAIGAAIERSTAEPGIIGQSLDGWRRDAEAQLGELDRQIAVYEQQIGEADERVEPEAEQQVGALRRSLLELQQQLDALEAQDGAESRGLREEIERDMSALEREIEIFEGA